MKHPLNFNWSYTPYFHATFKTQISKSAFLVDLPHNMVEFPFNYYDVKDFDVEGTYSKEIILNGVSPDRDYVLVFEGVNNGFTLFINGNEVGSYARPYMQERINISNFVQEGNNLIVVRVTGSEKVEAPPFGHTVDFMSFPGIYREVNLYVYPALCVLDAKIDARANGAINVVAQLRNVKEENDFSLSYEVYDDTKLLKKSSAPSFTVEDITAWSPNTPRLYYLRLVLTQNGKESVKGITFGFRDVYFKEGRFYLNNKPFILLGTNRHETFPYLGGAAPSFLQYSDALAIKKLGLNYVRCSHYPPSSAFLEACDYLGLLVVNEVPGWQHIGNEAWQQKHLSNIETMINRDYNHPSVFMWSIRINESNDHDMYLACHTLAKRLDPYRPTTGTRNFKHSVLHEDVYSYNDFSHNGRTPGLLPKKKVVKTKKAYIVSENNGHMFPAKVYDSPNLLLEHTKRHLNVFNAFFKNPDIAGISPWCMHDYYTHDEFGSGDHICYHGVLDIFRSPKPAAYAYMSNFSDESVLFPLFRADTGDLPESRRYETYVLSNAHHLKLFYGDTFVQTFYPRTDLYPYLPSPPFVLDTFISNDFMTTIPFSAKDKLKVARLLNYAALHNFDKLKLRMKLTLLRLMLKYRLKYADLVPLWTDNVALWGDRAKDYTLIAYNEAGEELKRMPYHVTKEKSYDITLARDALINEATYDATTVTVTSVSPLRNHYDFSVVTITTTGPIKLLGPSSQALHGGATTLYFRSLKETGSATITISVQNTTKTFNLSVK